MGCISFSRSAIPPGIKLLRRVRNKDFSFDAYRTSVLLLTFIAYTLYHASRKPASIVKDVLQSDSVSNSFLHDPVPPWPHPDPPPNDNEAFLHRPPLLHDRPHSSEDHNEEFLHRPPLLHDRRHSYTSFKHRAKLAQSFQQSFDVHLHSYQGRRPGSFDGLAGGLPQIFEGSRTSGKQNVVLMKEREPFNANKDAKKSSFIENSEGLDGEVAHPNEPAQLGEVELKGWAPFNTSKGTALLGEVDVAFLASYAIGMYFAGHIGDRLCNRWFLTVGMIGSGICVSLFGMAYWWNIHWLGYFLIVQIIAGFFQATGWPSVVTVVAKWFGKRKRGLVMGIWNAHTSVGNILGSLICSAMLSYGWGWAFIVPGISIAFGGFLIFLFLVVDPEIVGFPSPNENSERGSRKPSGLVEQHLDPEQGLKSEPLISSGDTSDSHQDAIGFFKAWTIPGVAVFALCLFFAKLVAYTFLYWLPFYIRHTEIQGHYLSDSMSGNLSTVFDIGGIFGGILAGYLSDRLRARAMTAASFMYLSIPALLVYNVFGSISLWLNIVLMFITGMLVNGPYALITTAVSADLGTHKSLKGNSKALGTVAAIIDGTGSAGAAVGPLLTGYLSQTGWNSVFYMLMLSALFAGLLLSKLVVAELRDLRARAKAARETS